MADVEKSPNTEPAAAPTTPSAATDKSVKPGQSWKQHEEHVLPHNRIGIVFFGLMSCTFLAALDQVCPSEGTTATATMLTGPLDDRSDRSAYHCSQARWRQRI